LLAAFEDPPQTVQEPRVSQLPQQTEHAETNSDLAEKWVQEAQRIASVHSVQMTAEILETDQTQAEQLAPAGDSSGSATTDAALVAEQIETNVEALRLVEIQTAQASPAVVQIEQQTAELVEKATDQTTAADPADQKAADQTDQKRVVGVVATQTVAIQTVQKTAAAAVVAELKAEKVATTAEIQTVHGGTLGEVAAVAHQKPVVEIQTVQTRISAAVRKTTAADFAAPVTVVVVAVVARTAQRKVADLQHLVAEDQTVQKSVVVQQMTGSAVVQMTTEQAAVQAAPAKADKPDQTKSDSEEQVFESVA
jgi:hypothetical protein